MDDRRDASSRHMVTNLVILPPAKDLLWLALVNIPLKRVTMHNTELKSSIKLFGLSGIKDSLTLQQH